MWRVLEIDGNVLMIPLQSFYTSQWLFFDGSPPLFYSERAGTERNIDGWAKPFDGWGARTGNAVIRQLWQCMYNEPHPWLAQALALTRLLCYTFLSEGRCLFFYKLCSYPRPNEAPIRATWVISLNDLDERCLSYRKLFGSSAGAS